MMDAVIHKACLDLVELADDLMQAECFPGAAKALAVVKDLLIAQQQAMDAATTAERYRAAIDSMRRSTT